MKNLNSEFTRVIKMFLYNFFNSIVFIMLFVLTLSGCQNNSKHILAENYDEYQKVYFNKEVIIVRNKKDFKILIESNKFLKEKLNSQVIIEFVDKLKMGKKGLITFSYKMIIDSVSKSDLSRILDEISILFGWASFDKLAVDHQGYYCAGEATCKSEMNSICIGENCK